MTAEPAAAAAQSGAPAAPNGSTMVSTARGPVDVNRLGRTLTHEHLFVVDAEYATNYLDASDVETIVNAAARQLEDAREAGVDTVVDLTVHGIGRMIPWIERLAARTDVNLIVATGAYVRSDVPMLWSMRGPGTALGGPEPMTEVFVRDIVEGVGRSGVRAAALKCVTDTPGLTAGVVRTLRAVADAQRQTGVPVFTHTDAATRCGLDQQRVLADSGADLSRVVIGHSGDTDDLDYLEQLLGRGSYVGLDRFGWAGPLPLERRIGVVVELARRGWLGRLLLSHDSALYHAWMTPEVTAAVAPDARLTFVPTHVIPLLRAHGLAEGDLEQLLVNNPRSLWERAS